MPSRWETDAPTEPSSASSDHPPATVSDFTEPELVGRICRRLPPSPSWLTVGIGDDAAIVEPERNRLEALSVDAIVEGVHFDRRFTPPDAIGHRALAVNLSDLAAMGAAPRLALLSMALPSAFPVAEFDAVADGFAALANRYGVHVAGGNLTRSPGPLMIDVTVVGTVKRRGALVRGGARPGDHLYVSGTIGAAGAGLRMLQSAVASGEPAVEHWRPSGPAVERYLRPEPRVRLGVLLGRNRAASACIDLSDGLADAVSRVAEASGVGAIIDGEALPIDPDARAWFEAHGADPVREAIAAGDDYELLVAVRPRHAGRLRAVERHADVPLTRIGTCTGDRQIVLRRDSATSDWPRGYSHFR